MENKPKEKWCFKTSTLIIAFLCVGPLALPLVWFNPRLSPKIKIIISVIIIVLSYYVGVLLRNSLNSIASYYKILGI